MTPPPRWHHRRQSLSQFRRGESATVLHLFSRCVLAAPSCCAQHACAALRLLISSGSTRIAQARGAAQLLIADLPALLWVT